MPEGLVSSGGVATQRRSDLPGLRLRTPCRPPERVPGRRVHQTILVTKVPDASSSAPLSRGSGPSFAVPHSFLALCRACAKLHLDRQTRQRVQPWTKPSPIAVGRVPTEWPTPALISSCSPSPVGTAPIVVGLAPNKWSAPVPNPAGVASSPRNLPSLAGTSPVLPVGFPAGTSPPQQV
ncbi:hypothetical protein R1flu_019544 [Riccia fluitans]|uniref:Uncharacterized protein n=1 Tax=Riccia fluitans TaxID=41844 RepID=A0ABD1ZKI0_9MARC